MPSTNWSLADALNVGSPNTYQAMQKFVMALADMHNNFGKKSFWGADQTAKYANRMMEQFIPALAAMHQDGIIDKNSDVNDALQQTHRQIDKMKVAFPNWQEAYSAYDAAFKKNPEAARIFASKFLSSM